jgi:uncharacterized membrane protein
VGAVQANDDPAVIEPEPAPDPAPGRSPDRHRHRHHDHRPHRLRTALLLRPTYGGLVIGLLAWWRSVYPTLLPRGWLAQAVISALCFSLGYIVGTFGGWLVHQLLDRTGREPSPSTRRLAWRALAIVGAVAIVAGAVLWFLWQNDQRGLVNMGDLGPVTLVPMVCAATIVTAVFFLLGRLVWFLVRALQRLLDRFVPAPIGAVATALLVIAAGFFLTRDVVLDKFFSWTNDRFAAFNDTTPDGTVAPTSAAVSGSPDSLAAWDTLGYYGRQFVAGSTPEQEIRAAAASDAEPVEPVRVYVGLQSAADPDDRAALAVKELERTGAFDRELLVVVTTTGTGWIDPDAARVIEVLHGGNTAIVGMQYSYLPSWISFLVDGDKASAAGRALYTAVHDAWSDLDPASRPRLLVFGLSLGSFGAEAPFLGSDVSASVDNYTGGTDGVLLVGPTASNPVYRQLLPARESGTPVWLPVFDDGKSVRFANRPSDVEAPFDGWDGARVLYFHHPSDPVGVWDWETLWSPPEWMDRPRGYDVPDRGSWVPVVTWVQTVHDLIAGFSAPPGHGHDYSVDYVSAFAAVVPPDGWTQADTDRLSDLLRTPLSGD